MPEDQRFLGTTDVTLRRPYALDVPAGPTPSNGFPVLVGLHGFGETGPRLSERLCGLAGAPYARLFPDAPYPIEMREESGARVGAAWYQYTGDQAAFLVALGFAREYLAAVLARAAAAHPIDPTRAVLLGYSQGGYLAGVAAFAERNRYRGLVGIACRIKTEALAAEIPRARGYPVLLIHGERDAHTPLDRQREALAELRRHGVDATLHVHDGGHGLRAEAAPLVDAFVRRVLQIPESSS